MQSHQFLLCLQKQADHTFLLGKRNQSSVDTAHKKQDAAITTSTHDILYRGCYGVCV